MTNSASPSTHNNIVPSEVGWQFVPQYYTFVNKQPSRLHCFYTKTSTFIHGTEGEDGKPCYGQQEIHNKITSIGFEDCKVFIHSVDAQSSANGGIIIQVIGEMSNHGEAWRKFVQTFFLAEQPNGYFVLNDIFRFLKEETVEGDDASDTAEAEATAAAPVVQEPPTTSAPAPVPAAELVYEPPREPTPPPVVNIAAPTPAAAVIPPPPAVEEAPTTDVPEPPTIVQTPTPAPEPQQSTSTTAPITSTTQTNGIHTPEPEQPAPAPVVEKSPSPSPAPQEPISTPAPPAPAAAAPAPPPAVQASAPAPAPSAPTAPRSWASLAASNSKKWGAAVAQESRGTTETPASPSPASGTQTPSNVPSTPVRGPQQQHHHYNGGQGSGQRSEHPNFVAAQNVTITQCFVKGITSTALTPAHLTNALGRFGTLKDVDIIHSKACAFLDFTTLDAAKKAITASLPQNMGGEGGIWIEVGGEPSPVRISVETKREKGDRPSTRPRGGVVGEAVGRRQLGRVPVVVEDR
ncbi:hypothetical protein BD779DRAFT_1671759 [Infundibulicybe gibba]|nr:hypothetical protein BD779DRAFT_1671759 [Infundibulicybe gibba]